MTELKRVSMRDLAREANVSVMTVSLALRNQPGVSEETRNRIQKLARERGYRPDPALSALISYRRNKSSRGHLGAIAFLNFQHETSTSPTSYINQMFQGASKQAITMGYKVYQFAGPTTAAEATRLKRILKSRGIRGLMVSPVADINHPPVFDWEEFSVVCLGVSFARRVFHTVSGDTYHGGLLCAAQLHHAGSTRIGVCLTWDQIDRVEQRFTGGAAAYVLRVRKGLSIIPPLYTDAFPPKGKDADSQFTEELLEWYNKYQPDGIITGYGEMADFLRKQKIFLPENFSVTSPFVSGEHITYTDQRFPEWGVWAMNTLGGLLKNNEVGIPDQPVEILIRGRLVHKGSVTGKELSYKEELDAGFTFPPVVPA